MGLSYLGNGSGEKGEFCISKELPSCMRLNDAQPEGAILSYSLSSSLPMNIPSLADNILYDDPSMSY